MSAGTAAWPIPIARRQPASLMAGRRVKSCAGRPCPTGTTRSSAPASRASWLIAAPPAAKFATIWSVTSAGKAETPCRAISCQPTNTRISTRSSRGGCRPCQADSHPASSSRRPRAPGGLVSSASRAAPRGGGRLVRPGQIGAAGRADRRGWRRSTDGSSLDCLAQVPMVPSVPAGHSGICRVARPWARRRRDACCRISRSPRCS